MKVPLALIMQTTQERKRPLFPADWVGDQSLTGAYFRLLTCTSFAYLVFKRVTGKHRNC